MKRRKKCTENNIGEAKRRPPKKIQNEVCFTSAPLVPLTLNIAKQMNASRSIPKATLVFVSRLLGHRVCGRQEKKTKKQHIEHERVQVLGTTEHERGLTRTPLGKKHTLNTRG